jgi:predicted N-acyltransferase
LKNKPDDYVIRVLDSPQAMDGLQWNELLARQDPAGALNPFMRHEYLAAMQASGSAVPDTGWTPRFMALYDGTRLVAACALYLKSHSYGEYVFDWAWANAYQQHGLAYYPKALVATPFTPVPGPRLLAEDATARVLLVKALMAWCESEKLSSLHLLFGHEADIAACAEAGLMLRHTVQFHWKNEAPTLVAARTALPPTHTQFKDFEDFLSSLNQEKRKKIRQERRKVTEAGVIFRTKRAADISPADWDFFYRCYERTYLEHGNAPYLSRNFFELMANQMPENWLMFVAEREAKPMACSLIALSTGDQNAQKTAYGRYWGALERVDCLHFEACYYQPLQWCIANGFDSFEGGAQGEHKMARALLPVMTTSAHWLAHPSFADAVERFLSREEEGIAGYMQALERRNPFKPKLS